MATSASSSSPDSSLEEPAISDESVPHLPPMAVAWDPQNCKDWDCEKPTPQCITRIKKFEALFDFVLLTQLHLDLGLQGP